MNRLKLAATVVLVLTVLSCSKTNSESSAGQENGGNQTKASSQSSASQDKTGQSNKGGASPGDTVRIPSDNQQRAGIQVAPVIIKRVPRRLAVAGQVQLDEQHTSHLGTIAAGRITAANVLPGALVRRGELLGSLHSHMVHETVGALLQAYAGVSRQNGALAFARQAQQRYHHLYSIQAASLEESQRSDQEVLQAEKQLADAQASVHMEREHLAELLQVAPESLNAGNLYDKELIPIRSPIDGVVITRNISVGQVVDTGFDAFDISNLSTIWVTAAVNQQDVALIHAGAPADMTISGYADKVFHGRVGMVGDTLDPQTRTVPVRIVAPNRNKSLRPGMFASVLIAEPATRDAVFVPENALQDINGMRVVFVTSDGVTFKARAVDVGARSMGQAEITHGLQSGDRIVVSGAFMVKAEMLKGTMGEG